MSWSGPDYLRDIALGLQTKISLICFPCFCIYIACKYTFASILDSSQMESSDATKQVDKFKATYKFLLSSYFLKQYIFHQGSYGLHWLKSLICSISPHSLAGCPTVPSLFFAFWQRALNNPRDYTARSNHNLIT